MNFHYIINDAGVSAADFTLILQTLIDKKFIPRTTQFSLPVNLVKKSMLFFLIFARRQKQKKADEYPICLF